MDLSAALRWRGLAMTVLESHDERESLLGITNFLNEMTYSKVFDTLCSKFLFSVISFCDVLLHVAEDGRSPLNFRDDWGR
jgi:hypothetical protein